MCTSEGSQNSAKASFAQLIGGASPQPSEEPPQDPLLDLGMADSFVLAERRLGPRNGRGTRTAGDRRNESWEELKPSGSEGKLRKEGSPAVPARRARGVRRGSAFFPPKPRIVATKTYDGPSSESSRIRAAQAA